MGLSVTDIHAVIAHTGANVDVSAVTNNQLCHWRDGAQRCFLSCFLYLRTVCGMVAFLWKWWQDTSQSLSQLTRGLYHRAVRLVRSAIRQHRCLAGANVGFLGFHFLLEMERDSLPGASFRKGELPEAVSRGGYFKSSMAIASAFKTFARGAGDRRRSQGNGYVGKCHRSVHSHIPPGRLKEHPTECEKWRRHYKTLSTFTLGRKWKWGFVVKWPSQGEIHGAG